MTIDESLAAAIEHHKANRLAEAERIYREILKQQPQHVDALRLLGMIATRTGHAEAAITLIERAMRIEPQSREVQVALADAFSTRADELSARGALTAAVEAYRRAIQLLPEYVSAHTNRSDALCRMGRFDEALASADEAIRLHPDFSAALNNRGNALLHMGRREEALAAYDAALRADPRSAEAHSNRGNALVALGRADEALLAHEAAAQIAPQSPQVLTNFAGALRDAHRIDEALSAQRQAVAANPQLPESRVNLGNILRETGEISAAIDEYRTAVRLRPTMSTGWSNLLYALAFDSRVTGEQILSEHAAWGRMIEKSVPRRASHHHAHPRLRVGYVSPDLREHPAGRFMLPLLANHDREQFEIFAYADNARNDDISTRLRSLVDHWHDTISLGDSELADLIRRDGIDILVDLAVHSAGNRFIVFAAKPAPVQVTYLGYPGTTGLTTMDYRLTDHVLDPPGADSLYTERSMRLETTYWCYAEPEDAPAVPNAPPLQSNGHVTLGCLNSFAKVSTPALETWAKLLAAVPHSRLLLHSAPGTHRQRVLDLFAQHDVAADRIDFISRLSRADYFAAYHRLDIALDPFPASGATTTCDALWMGVPVVTVAGDCAPRRSSASLLTFAGLPELITTNPDAYFRVAIELANDATRLANLRATLRDRMRASPIMNTPDFVRDIERCYREMSQSTAR